MQQCTSYIQSDLGLLELLAADGTRGGIDELLGRGPFDGLGPGASAAGAAHRPEGPGRGGLDHGGHGARLREADGAAGPVAGGRGRVLVLERDAALHARRALPDNRLLRADRHRGCRGERVIWSVRGLRTDRFIKVMRPEYC